MGALIATTTTARCILCDWTATGEPTAVDLAARKHTGEGAYSKKPGPHHATITETVPT